MEVSLYHRLVGIGTGAMVYAAQDPALGKRWAVVMQRLDEWSVVGEGGEVSAAFTEQGLENALMVLPMMVFFHEDPLYLGDRLRDLPLPSEQLPMVLALAHLLSACLRERFTGENFGHWLTTHGAGGDLWADLAASQPTWRQLTEAMVRLKMAHSQQQLFTIYGAIAYGRGQWHQSLAFVRECEPILQMWVAMLVGGLRGDRRLPIPVLQRQQAVILHDKVRRFWSRWSGLPSGNQLHLEQIPLIASGQVLQCRPTLKLISQRHLP